jgi:HK97 family phage portal protein
MGLFRRRQQRDFYGITGAEDLIPGRAGGGSRQVGSVVVTDDRAMRHSVVWACLKLRAGLISTFPIDQYRDVLGIQTEYNPKPPILTDPGGMKMDIVDFLAATQVDLDRSGNAVGLIVERSASRSKYHPKGLPARIELQQASACSYVQRPGKPDFWRIGRDEYAPDDVYHERANVVAGLPVGLPTVLYAALTIGESQSMQDFGLSWFAGGGVPKAQMKNVAKRLEGPDITKAKQWYRDVVNNGDLLVTGSDWEYHMIQAQNAGTEFIDGRKLTDAAVCRFFDTPGDLVDVGAQGSSITYANITQRLLEYLILRLGPAVQRREKEFTKLLPTPRYVKFNTDALLRMDPETRQKVLASRIESRLLANSEARALDNNPPLTAAQKKEFIELYGAPKAAATPGAGTGAAGTEQGSDTEPATAGV